MMIKPKTIDDIIERLNELKDQYGNIEVRTYNGRYSQEPDFDTYPQFAILPSDMGLNKIVVVL